VKAVLAVVTLAIILTALGGLGFIVARVFDAPGVALWFGYVLLAAVGTTLLALATALVVGLWHLYLYLFTDKKPVSLFASVSRDEK
jgi:hypothetical protein